jgi:plasmid stability protein
MKGLLVRNLDEGILERLKRRARARHRSLQGEIHAILAAAANDPPGDLEQPLDLVLVNTKGQQDWSREAIYED